MIEHLNMSYNRLSELLLQINGSAAAYQKKSARQPLLAKVIRKAIWNWIDNHPNDFVDIWKNGKRMEGNDSKKKKKDFVAYASGIMNRKC